MFNSSISFLCKPAFPPCWLFRRLGSFAQKSVLSIFRIILDPTPLSNSCSSPCTKRVPRYWATSDFDVLNSGSVLTSVAPLLSIAAACTLSAQAIVAHAAGALALSFFLLDSMCSTNIWYIFAFCSLLPTLYELALLYLVFVRKMDT